MYKEREDLDSWIQKWDDAQKNGILKAHPSEIVPSKQTADSSFFGFVRTNDSQDELNMDDTQYWAEVYNLSHYSTPGKVLKEEFATIDKKQRSTVSANPVRTTSIGKDQDLEPLSVGSTYESGDLESLANLKLKLHGLLDKLNTFNGKGQSPAKLESQIETLKKQIDELSDNLCGTVKAD